MNTNDTIGLIAGALTTISFLPQLIKIWKSKSAGDLSLGMFTIFSTGVSLWICYGINMNSIPIVAANVLTLIFCLMILFFKVKYK